jgi:hypothetical protein
MPSGKKCIAPFIEIGGNNMELYSFKNSLVVCAYLTVVLPVAFLILVAIN